MHATSLPKLLFISMYSFAPSILKWIIFYFVILVSCITLFLCLFILKICTTIVVNTKKCNWFCFLLLFMIISLTFLTRRSSENKRRWWSTPIFVPELYFHPSQNLMWTSFNLKCTYLWFFVIFIGLLCM